MPDMTAAPGLLSEGEVITRRVFHPGVIVGTFNAGMQPDSLSGQLPSGQGTGIGQRASGLTLDLALFLPRSERVDSRDLSRLLDPL